VNWRGSKESSELGFCIINGLPLLVYFPCVQNFGFVCRLERSDIKSFLMDWGLPKVSLGKEGGRKSGDLVSGAFLSHVCARRFDVARCESFKLRQTRATTYVYCLWPVFLLLLPHCCCDWCYCCCFRDFRPKRKSANVRASGQ